MKRREPMKNLWAVSARRAGATFIHRLRLQSSRFDPIFYHTQGIDPVKHFGVIPLPRRSY
jgi:hypothetical protein